MTEQTTTTTADPVTSIEALNRQWERANAAYEAAEATLTRLHGGKVTPESISAQQASTTAFEEAHQLHLAILYQRPQNWRDALILTAHINIAADYGIRDIAEDERYPIALAAEALATFIADQAYTGEPFGGWTEQTLYVARAHTEARSPIAQGTV